MSKSIDINWANIKAQYIYSPEKISIADLTKQCHKQGIKVAQGTIGNRARDENWVEKRKEYWDKINKTVARRITTQITQRRLNNVKIIDAVTNLGARNLLKKLKSDPEYVVSPTELDKLMRLQEFLLGFSDSRQEKRIKLEKPLEEMSDEELEKARDKILDATYEVMEENDNSDN
jgi:hypothetical protein